MQTIQVYECGMNTKTGAFGEVKYTIKAGKVDTAAGDSNRQYKEMQLQGDERDAAGLFFSPWGHETNCHHWSCLVLDKSQLLYKEMKNKGR